MKYIDAEKLIAEIERQLSAHDKVDHLEAFEVGKAWNRGHRMALENILNFIAYLQQEQLKVDAEWMAGQGQTFEAHIDNGCAVASGVKLPFVLWNTYEDGDVLIVQIRKK